MSKFQSNYFCNLSKNNLNKNIPKTPCRRSSLIKDSNIKANNKKNFNNLLNKEEKSNISVKKNYKLYSSSILNKKNNIDSKNYEVKCKDIKSFSNSREFKSYINDKNINYKDRKINLSNKNNKKKGNYLFFYENYKTKKGITNKLIEENKEKSKENKNKINKTQSITNNSNLSYNSFNYITNTVKNAKNSSVKNIPSKSKSRPTSLLLNKKLKEEKRHLNKARPMTLLETSNNKNENDKLKNQPKNNEIEKKKNFLINTTHINYFNNCKISNSNYFLKNNIFFNKTCNNDAYNSNIINSDNNSNPIIINEKMSKYNKINNRKEVIKSQSQSHIFYQKSQYKMKNDNNSKTDNEKFDNLSSKKIIRNKPTNFNLNINNINNFNNKYLFNCNNLNKSSPSITTKSQIVNVKYPYDEKNKYLFYNETNNKYDLIHMLNNLPEEFTKDKIFMKLIDLWNKLGGVNYTYAESFIKYTKNNEDKNILFQNEINQLTLIINKLNNLNENIKKRNDIIEKIKSLINNNNFEQIKQLLNFLSSISITIINEYNHFMKEISFDLFMNKYNILRINNFDINYLSRMETDCNFLADNPNIIKNFGIDKRHPYLSLIKGEENNNMKDFCKFVLLKNKIYHDLLNEEENYSNNQNNINLNFENLFSNNNNFSNRSETNLSIKSENINKYNITEQNNRIIENNINLTITPKKELYTENNNNSKIDEGKKDIEIFRNDIIYNSKNFNLFTFGREVKLPKIKNEDILSISPYNQKKDPKLILLYTSYISSIDEKMKLSFNINNDIYYYFNLGIYPKIFLFKDLNSNVKAFCTLSYDYNITSDKKILTITNISCMDGYKISKILLSLIEYCKNNEIYFDSIEINLYYIKKEGKFILDEEYENEIKNEAKFKWVKLENDGEKRKIKYHYVNNNIINYKENSINNKRKNIPNINQTQIGVNIINYSLIKYYQEVGNQNILFSEHNQLYLIINLLKRYYLIDDIDDEINHIIGNFGGIKLKKILKILSEYNHILVSNPKDFKNYYYKDDNFNIEFLSSFLEKIENNKNEDDDLLCLNNYNVFTNFKSIIKTEINGYEYNIISLNNYLIEAFNINDIDDEDTIENNSNFNIYDNEENAIKNNNDNKEVKQNDILYFLKSEHDDISFIFYEINEDNKDLSQNEIDTLFNKVLKKILIKDNEEPIKSYNKICIPSFQYKKRNTVKENMEDKKNENLKLIEYELLDYNEQINFCIENLANNEIKFSFPSFKKIEDNEDVKILKNDFIIAVINPDLVLDYHLPAMSIFYINKEHWIKINK